MFYSVSNIDFRNLREKIDNPLWSLDFKRMLHFDLKPTQRGAILGDEFLTRNL